MKYITYQEKEYPTRSFNIIIDGEEEEITIATESLEEDIEHGMFVTDSEEEGIDQGIYFYIEDHIIDQSVEEIQQFIQENCEDIEIINEIL